MKKFKQYLMFLISAAVIGLMFIWNKPAAANAVAP